VTLNGDIPPVIATARFVEPPGQMEFVPLITAAVIGFEFILTVSVKKGEQDKVPSLMAFTLRVVAEFRVPLVKVILEPVPNTEVPVAVVPLAKNN
jgi:hypothetical protein